MDLTRSLSGSTLPEKTNHALAKYKEAKKVNAYVLMH